MNLSGFRPRSGAHSRVAALGIGVAPLVLTAGLLLASGARPAAASLVGGGSSASTSTTSYVSESTDATTPCPTLLPTLLPTLTPVPSLLPCPSETPTLSPTPPPTVPPSESAVPTPTVPTIGTGPTSTPEPGGGLTGGGGSTGDGGSTGSTGSIGTIGSIGGLGSTVGSSIGGDGSSGGDNQVGATPMPAGTLPPRTIPSAQELVGSLVVADPLLASQTVAVLQNPVSEQQPDLLHFSLDAATGAGATGYLNGGAGPFGGSQVPAVLMALAGFCLVGAGTAMLVLRRISTRIRLFTALLPIALGVPLSAAAATSVTSVALAPASATMQLPPTQLVYAGHGGAATSNQVRSATNVAATQAPAWTQLVAIENSITAGQAQLASEEQQIAQLATQLKQPAQAQPAPHAAKQRTPQVAMKQLAALIAQHSALDAQYQRALQQEYQFFEAVAQSAQLTAQVQSALPAMPPAVQSAVAYDLTTVRTELQQEAAIRQATAAPGIGSANAVAAELAARTPITFHAPLSGVLTQGFGPTIWSMEPPITYNGVFYPHFHTGLDIAAPLGSPVGAAAQGVVILATSSRDAEGNLVGYGNYVVIRHPNGYLTLYGHLEQLLVTAGEVVQQGQVIGLCGSTGWSTGPHVHFEIRVNGVYVNPLPFLGGEVR